MEATGGFDIQLSGYGKRDEQMKESVEYIVTVWGKHGYSDVMRILCMLQGQLSMSEDQYV